MANTPIAYFVCSRCGRGQNYEGPAIYTLVNCFYCKTSTTIPESQFKLKNCQQCEDKNVLALKFENDRLMQENERLRFQIKQLTPKDEIEKKEDEIEKKEDEILKAEEPKENDRFTFLEVE